MGVEGMVHALEQAARVVQPGGLLIDLRPAPVHRRVGVIRGADILPAGSMREELSSDRLADAALKRFLRSRRADRLVRKLFVCNRYLENPKAFRAYIAEFASAGELPRPHDWLIRRVDQAWQDLPGKKRVIISAPLMMTVMRRKG